MNVIELGDQLAVLTVPIVELGCDDPSRLHLLVKADPVEQLQRGGMVGTGARHLVEEIAVGEPLDQRNRDPALRQRQREAQAD